MPSRPSTRLDVHPLTPDRWNDLVTLFNTRGGSQVRSCWCMFYRRSGRAGVPDHIRGAGPSRAANSAPLGGSAAREPDGPSRGRTPECAARTSSNRPQAWGDHSHADYNRRSLKALVDAGTAPGLIGYRDGRPVAWVSLGPREDYAKLARSPVMKPVDDKAVWSVICFYTALDVRGEGLSEAMLAHAADYARRNGARLLEAYPVDKTVRDRDDAMWFGAKRMYDRAGFTEVARRKPTRPVMRKTLRPKHA